MDPRRGDVPHPARAARIGAPRARARPAGCRLHRRPRIRPPPSGSIPAGEVAKLASTKIEAFLARCDLFKGADKSIVARAAALLAGVEVPAGTAVVTAGAPSDGLGIVFSGALSVRLPDGSEVETLGPGDHFCDAALVLGGPSPTTLLAS